jgi:hypothetical protein
MYKVIIGSVVVARVFTMDEGREVLKEYGLIGLQENEGESGDYAIIEEKVYELVVHNKVVAKGNTREELLDLAKDYVPNYLKFRIQEIK